jgi:hypothetical protein
MDVQSTDSRMTVVLVPSLRDLRGVGRAGHAPHRLVTKREISRPRVAERLRRGGDPHGARGGSSPSARRPRGDQPAYIETVSRAGYRFIAEVRDLTAAERREASMTCGCLSGPLRWRRSGSSCCASSLIRAARGGDRQGRGRWNPEDVQRRSDVRFQYVPMMTAETQLPVCRYWDRARPWLWLPTTRSDAGAEKSNEGPPQPVDLWHGAMRRAPASTGREQGSPCRGSSVFRERV